MHCQAETEMVEGGVPICAQCAKPKIADAPKAVQETIRSVLQDELKWATERAATASAAFLEITSKVPSGLPHPDGTQRIRNLSHELAFARAELMKAHARLEAYLMNGTTPDDLIPSSDH